MATLRIGPGVFFLLRQPYDDVSDRMVVGHTDSVIAPVTRAIT